MLYTLMYNQCITTIELYSAPSFVRIAYKPLFKINIKLNKAITTLEGMNNCFDY